MTPYSLGLSFVASGFFGLSALASPGVPVRMIADNDTSTGGYTDTSRVVIYVSLREPIVDYRDTLVSTHELENLLRDFREMVQAEHEAYLAPMRIPAFPTPRPAVVYREEVMRAPCQRVKERPTRARARSGPASNRTSDERTQGKPRGRAFEARPRAERGDAMPALIVKMEGENAWPDLRGKEVIHLANDAEPIQLAALAGGMKSGKPSVMFRFDLPDGRTVLAETSLAVLQCACAFLTGKFGDVT